MNIKFGLKCQGTGRVLEKKLSDYAKSYDYYPVPNKNCQQDTYQLKSKGIGLNNPFVVVYRN